jgi:hypothetical protein
MFMFIGMCMYACVCVCEYAAHVCQPIQAHSHGARYSHCALYCSACIHGESVRKNLVAHGAVVYILHGSVHL